MYISLNKTDRADLLKHVRIHIGVKTIKYMLQNPQRDINTTTLKGPIMGKFVEDADLEDVPIISFIDYTVDSHTIVEAWRRIDNLLTEMSEVYEALCREALKKIELFSKMKTRKSIKICTADPVTIEILLDLKYSLTKKFDGKKIGYEAIKHLH